MSHSPQPWKEGKPCDAIVSGSAEAGDSTQEYYGGKLVAESMQASDRALILHWSQSHAKLVMALKQARTTIESLHYVAFRSASVKAWGIYLQSPEMRMINEALQMEEDYVKRLGMPSLSGNGN